MEGAEQEEQEGLCSAVHSSEEGEEGEAAAVLRYVLPVL